MPVVVFLAINLITYLYVITVNVKELNLYKPTTSDYSSLLIIGSYFTTAVAMLLTLTSYFSLRAYMKREKAEVTSQTIAESKLGNKDNKTAKIDVAKNSKQKDASIGKPAVEVLESKSPETRPDQAHEKSDPPVKVEKASQEPIKTNKID